MNDIRKVELGQFFTVDKIWLKNHILKFIQNSSASIVYDPYAGNGDILKLNRYFGIELTKGLDIDPSLKWELNDSLMNIPSLENSIIVTNPPYLAKQSATRRKIDVSRYFEESKYDDLYLIALDRMLDSSDNVVAIVPESFVNSNFKRKNRLVSITILEENPFLDTEVPVCVVCFDNIEKKDSNIKIYKNNTMVGTYDRIKSIKLKPRKSVKIKFNDVNGWLALRAVDSKVSDKKILFGTKNQIDYDWDNNISDTSRHYTLLSVEVPVELREKMIKECNMILARLRLESYDLILTPFMGNNNLGERRRRLDFKLARAIIEMAYAKIDNNNLRS